MNRQTTRVLIAALWLASLAGVYFLGQSSTSPVNPNPGSSITVASPSTPSPGDRRVGLPTGSDSDPSANALREPKDISRLVTQARLAIGSGDGSLRAFAPLLGLTAAQLREALEEVDRTTKDTAQRNMLYSVLLEEWARSDGPAAMAFAEEKLKPRSAGIQGTILGAWARKDPNAAWRWYDTERQKDPTDRNNYMHVNTMAQNLFTGMAAADLDSALGRLNALDSQVRGLAIIGISNAASDTFARNRLLNHVASLPPALRTQIHETVVRSWGMNDPEAAVGWLRERPLAEQASILPALENTIMMRDPKRGAELLLEITPETDRPRAYETIVRHWAPRDPRNAMAWAKSVPEAELRSNTVARVYNHWRSQDTAAADSALAASGLADDQIAEIKKTPPIPRR